MIGKPAFRRVLLKLSGEAFAGEGELGFDMNTISAYAEEIKELKEMGISVAVVIGAGNIVRGAHLKGVDRAKADQMGMVATVLNSLMLEEALGKLGVSSRVFSAIEVREVVPFYSISEARRALDEGHVVIVGGGTGNPYFTTDTAAVLRALELKAEVLLKATNVDGIYDSDPKVNPNAKRFDVLSYDEVLRRGLRFMDATALQIAKDNKLPIIVFNLRKRGNIVKVVLGEKVGSVVKS